VLNKSWLIVILVAGVLSGCATLFSGTSEEVTITTAPEDARIFFNDRLVGTGSVTMTVGREYADNNRPYIKVSKEGFITQEFQLENEFNSVSIINLSSVYSWTTDFLSGAMFKYAPNTYHVQLLGEGSVGALPGKYTLERYVLTNYGKILEDLAKGYGEHFAALVEFGEDSSETANLLHQNKNDLLQKSSPMALSKAIAKLIL